MSNTVLPKPGQITHPEGIATELQDIPQWILWKPVKRGDKISKVPCLINGDQIDAHDRKHWRTFSDAVAAMQGDTQGRFGIGFVLDDTGLLCVDYDDHEGDDPEAVKEGAEYVEHLLGQTPTYAERSLNGKGRHLFYRATLPHGRVGGIVEKLNLEIYARQFIAMTGNALSTWPLPIANGQNMVDAWNLPPPVTTVVTIEPTQALGRALDLDDRQVIETLMVRRRATFDMIDSPLDLADRSDAFMKIIGDLDKITGDPMQINRIIRKAPFLENGYNAEKYEQAPKWLGRMGCASMFEYWLKQARASNTESIPYTELLTPERRALVESVIAAFERETAERQRVKLPTSPISSATAGVSRSFDEIMDGDDVDTSGFDSTPRMQVDPPVGRRARALYEDMLRRQHYPNPTIAWVATAALLAGIGHRSAFVEGTITLSQAIMLLSLTTDGKQAVADSLAAFQTLVRERDGSGQHHAFLNSFAAGEFSSQAAIGDRLEKTPRITSIIAEADYLLGAPETLSPHKADAMHEMMRVRTSCNFGQNLPGRASANGGRGRDRPTIECPSLNVIGDSQPTTLYSRVRTNSAEKGTLNRWSIIDSTRNWKGRRNVNNLRGFSMDVQRDLLALTDIVGVMEHVSTQQPSAPVSIPLSLDAISICGRFESKFLDGLTHDQDSMEFAIFGRTLVAAKSLAGVFALYENPHAPIIDGELMYYALRVTWDERNDLYTKFREGEIGQGDRQRLALLVKALRSSYTESRSKHLSTMAKQYHLVPRAWVVDQLSGYSAFAQDGHKGTAQLLSEVLAIACQHGILTQLEKGQEKHGLKGAVYQIDAEALRNF